MSAGSTSSALVAGLVAGAALGVSACAALRAWRAAPTAQCTPQRPAARAPPAASDAVFTEHCERTRLFLGDEAFTRVRGAFVVVVGLGGVGSMAATALARTGVRRLRLVDPDVVTVSSLNRHALATRADVGVPKVLAMAEHLRLVVPEVAVEPVEAFFTAELAQQLLEGSPDLVLDCIDDTKTKVQLLHCCVTRGLRVASSFGVGACVDPSRVRALDISRTYACPLGRRIRKNLARLGVTTGIPCVFSTEVGRRALAELSEEEHARLESQGISRQVRVRAVPSFMPVPAIAGLALADVGICMLAGLPHDFDGGDSPALQQQKPAGPTPADDAAGDDAAPEASVTASQAKRVLNDLAWREGRRAAPQGEKVDREALGRALTPEQALYAIRDAFGCTSVLSGRALRAKEMALVLRDRALPLALGNVVLLHKDEIEGFEAHRGEPLEPQAAARLDAALAALTDGQ